MTKVIKDINDVFTKMANQFKEEERIAAARRMLALPRLRKQIDDLQREHDSIEPTEDTEEGWCFNRADEETMDCLRRKIFRLEAQERDILDS